MGAGLGNADATPVEISRFAEARTRTGHDHHTDVVTNQPWSPPPPPPPPPYGAPPAKAKQPVWLWILLGVIGSVFLLCVFGAIIGAIVGDDEPDDNARRGIVAESRTPDQATTEASDVQSSPEPTPTSETPKEPAPDLSEMTDREASELGGDTGRAMGLPEDQRRFLGIVGRAQAAADGANEIGVVQARKTRGRQICRLLDSGLRVKQWVGVVDSVETTLGGDSGVLALTLADGVKVATWNNGFSDSGDDTLISEGSPVWTALGKLEEGDVIRFSAQLVDDDENCVRESSLIDLNGVLTPTFIARFEMVKVLADQ